MYLTFKWLSKCLAAPGYSLLHGDLKSIIEERLKEELDTICQASRETILRKIEQPRHTSKPKNVQTKHRAICNINVLTLDRQKITRRNTFVNSENYIVKSNFVYDIKNKLLKNVIIRNY